MTNNENHVIKSDDADDIQRTAVDDWSETELRTTGTNETIDGDGLTVPLENFQISDDGVVEIIVDGEVVHRLVGVSD